MTVIRGGASRHITKYLGMMFFLCGGLSQSVRAHHPAHPAPAPSAALSMPTQRGASLQPGRPLTFLSWQAGALQGAETSSWRSELEAALAWKTWVFALRTPFRGDWNQLENSGLGTTSLSVDWGYRTLESQGVWFSAGGAQQVAGNVVDVLNPNGFSTQANLQSGFRDKKNRLDWVGGGALGWAYGDNAYGYASASGGVFYTPVSTIRFGANVMWNQRFAEEKSVTANSQLSLATNLAWMPAENWSLECNGHLSLRGEAERGFSLGTRFFF